jgi:hypothetical protein
MDYMERKGQSGAGLMHGVALPARGFAHVFVRIFVEFTLAAQRAKVIRLSLILGFACGSLGVNIHTADWIVNGSH